jgi:hypothetical protein
MSKPIEIFRCKDKKENYYTKKGNLFDLPMRVLCIGKSQFSGKSSFLLNILGQEDKRLYKDDFEGDNIYIFSGSLKSDTKIKNLINQFDIPPENLNDGYDEDLLEAIFDLTEENYNEDMESGSKPKNTLIILDDVSFSGSLKSKSNGIINKIFCNGRHINLSIIATAQKYSQLHTTQRENATGIVLWSCSDKQLDLIADDHNTLESGKKQFKKMFRTATENPYSFMIVNYSNPRESLYMNMNFQPIGPCGKVKGQGCDCK